MDIKLFGNEENTGNYFERYASNSLKKYFHQFDFIQSINVFFRGSKHAMKKIKIMARFKGKEVFVESSGERYELAMDLAVDKLRGQISKYKGKRYR